MASRVILLRSNQFSKLWHLVPIFVSFSFLVDSGGGLYVRNIAIILIIILVAVKILNKMTFSFNGIIAYLVCGSFIAFSSLLSVIATNGLDFISWITFFLFFPVFYIFIKLNNVKVFHLIYGANLFCLVIVFIFILRIFFPLLADVVIYEIINGSTGFFNEKTLFGRAVPVTYFPATLALVPIGWMALREKNYFSALFILFALIIAPSRFGSTIMLLGFIVVPLFRFSSVGTSIIIASLFLVFPAISLLPLGDVRAGHASSLLVVLSDDISRLFFGMGPGSLFYSSGSFRLVSDIELSHLEFVRKYGIIFYTYFYFMIYFILARAADHRVAGLFLLSVCLTFLYNPGITSLNTALLLATLMIGENNEKPEKF